MSQKTEKQQEMIAYIQENLPTEECLDLTKRSIRIGGCQGTLYFLDSLHNGQKASIVLSFLMKIDEKTMSGIRSSRVFLEEAVPFLDASITTVEDAVIKVYSGLVMLLIDGFDEPIVMDLRDYPSRSVEEPDKERSLRGAKDGFTEGLMDNIGLIRRRLRNRNLVIKQYRIGELSQTDVVLAYIKHKCDPKIAQKLEETLQKLSNSREEIDTLTVSEQSLLEKLQVALGMNSKWNPFPKVRYSQRPDVITAHIAEGKVAILVDNSPTAMLIPVSILEFFQDVDDYYFPQITGNYFRLLRILNFFVILFTTPLYILLTEYQVFPSNVLDFFVPSGGYVVPIFWQFILLEISIDALKLASLNTPTTLGASLSIIGALILGEFSINSGWFIPQTILCMAVVALGAFTQPSIELSYAMKLCRIFMLIFAEVFGIAGIAVSVAFCFILIATTKTISGASYLYPLIPFDGKVLKKLIFRTQK